MNVEERVAENMNTPGQWIALLVLNLAITFTLCDIYLHNPRGSNNRLNEKSANRNNANRVFDSQNNNRGGYNVGDSTDRAAGNDENKQYQMKYFQSSANQQANGQGDSYLTFEWTNQHGCGGNEDTDPHKLNCNLVLQYMCQEEGSNNIAATARIRDGTNTATQNYNSPQDIERETEAQANARENNAVNGQRVIQENYDWYDSCYVRERNNGLFTADQYLDNNKYGYSSAIYTRQNPNGNRQGYECPEERDYYPYWHPSPWKDIAVLAENASMCEHYQTGSFNVQPYHECLEFFNGGNRKPYSRWNNQADCQENDGTWALLYNYLEKETARNKAACNAKGSRYMWQVPYDTNDGTTKQCLVALERPNCMEAPWSRSNHLGNGRLGEANNYTWTLPNFPSGKSMRCVSRLRYNISTDDYDPYNTDASQNQNKATGTFSPVQQNPYVEINAGASPLRLAINTAQFGRTFQDRSHVFLLNTRPNNIQNQRIFNLNVRGKRGNIVQVYPAVEYDFFPAELNLNMGDNDLVHIQWTGSNTHNNGNPGGDGQTGDAGEGRAGTDRSNFVQTHNADLNFPVPFENTTFWNNVEAVWMSGGGKTTANGLKPEELAIKFASAGYYNCLEGCNEGPTNARKMQVTLDNAPASYEGAVIKMKKTGNYYYICTRNNNFTNRSQKGNIIVR